MNSESLLDRVRVASPCNARWEDMAGDDCARFCRQCQKHVFNLSALTLVEAEQLVREKEGRFCGRFHQRRDGHVLTSDCPPGLRRCRERLRFLGGALAGALVFLLAGCRRPVMGKIAAPPGKLGEVQVSQPASTNPPPIMGDIAVPMPPTNPPAQ
jgi:hypothetical protein